MTDRADRARSLLGTLAGLHGIQLSYTRSGGGRIGASTEALLAGLRVLGAPVDRPGGVADACRVRRRELWGRVVEPVTVAWEGRLPSLDVRLPEKLAGRTMSLEAELEGGEVVRWPWAGETLEREEVDGVPFVRLAARLDGPVPLGYHTLRLRVGGEEHSSLLVSAPLRAVQLPGRTWGAFLPLYALRTARSWGPGDLTDLGALTEWLGSLGGSVAATLPLLAAFLDDREGVFEPGPYTPVSRMFWNELYVDPERAPELQRSPEARAKLRSRRFREELAELRRAPLIDYRRAVAAKRTVLEALGRALFAAPSPRSRELERFVRANPRMRDYARFRAAGRHHGGPWEAWPAARRDGRLGGDGGDRGAYRYHLYVQWLAAEQMAAAGRTARERGARLYFDLPIGVHPQGYDVWRDRGAFLEGASAGAPPDAFFSLGQSWGFPPLHPEGIREQRYRYFIDCIRHVFRHAGVVRLDHVMGLHRIYVVPNGMDARQGVYMRYRPQEAYAILALESARSGAAVVGEDLGTVAPEVRQAMARHGLQRSYVLYFDLKPRRRPVVADPPAGSVASVNTHDLPTFAAFWRGLDIAGRLELGLIGTKEAAAQRAERARLRRAVTAFLRAEGRLGRGEAERAVLRAALEHLASSEARAVLVNLEDLWLETRPQNVPGTAHAMPNWRRPARYAFEQFRDRGDVLGTLWGIDRARRGSGQP